MKVRSINELADPATDLTACLDGLTDLLGEDFMFDLIGKIRDVRGGGEAGIVRSKLARRMVDQEMRHNGGDEQAAIRTVGLRHGYTQQARGKGPDRNTVAGGTLGNFTRLVRGLVRAGNRSIVEHG